MGLLAQVGILSGCLAVWVHVAGGGEGNYGAGLQIIRSFYNNKHNSVNSGDSGPEKTWDDALREAGGLGRTSWTEWRPPPWTERCRVGNLDRCWRAEGRRGATRKTVEMFPRLDSIRGGRGRAGMRLSKTASKITEEQLAGVINWAYRTQTAARPIHPSLSPSLDPDQGPDWAE